MSSFSDLVGCPVEVIIAKGGAGLSKVTGNVYTVDPVSNDVVIITFNSDKKPDTVKWLPNHAVVSMVEVDSNTFGCHPKTPELAELMQGLFREVKLLDPEDMLKKKENLLTWLKRNHMEVKEDNGALLIFGCVRIEAPFTKDECYCDNAIVLKRVRQMVEKCPT